MLLHDCCIKTLGWDAQGKGLPNTASYLSSDLREPVTRRVGAEPVPHTTVGREEKLQGNRGLGRLYLELEAVAEIGDGQEGCGGGADRLTTFDGCPGCPAMRGL